MENVKINEVSNRLSPWKTLGCYEDGGMNDNDTYHLSMTRLLGAIRNQECFLASFSTSIPVSLTTFIQSNGLEECVFWYKRQDDPVTSFPWFFCVPQEVRFS